MSRRLRKSGLTGALIMLLPLLALGATLFPRTVLAARIWGEGHLATVLVGMDPVSHAPVRRLIMFAAVGPDRVEPAALHPRFATCMRRSVVQLVQGSETWSALDREVRPWSTLAEDVQRSGQPVNAATLGAARATRLQLVARIIVAADARFNSAMAACGLPIALSSKARLAIVNRVCLPEGSRPCSGNDYLDRPTYSSASRYSKVFEWMQSGGAAEENRVALIRQPDGMLMGVNIVTGLYPDRPWPVAPTADRSQRSFESGAVRMRERNQAFDYIAPRVIALPREAGYRLVDVIRDPAMSIPALPSLPAGAKALVAIQDEMARSRIRECVLLRAEKTVERVASCSGYRLDAATLANCMNSGTCLPAVNATGAVGVLEHAAVRRGHEMLETSLPRVGKLTLAQFEKEAKRCASKGDVVDASLCTTRASLQAPEQRTFDCARGVVTKRIKERGSLACLHDSLPAGPVKDLARCAERAATDETAKGLKCAVEATLPPPMRAAVACLEKSGRKKGADLLCLTGTVPPLVGGDAALVASCYQQSRASARSTLATIGCLGEARGLPKGTRETVECAGAAKNAEGVGLCIVTSKLALDRVGGDFGRLLQCSVQSGGDTIGTMGCMAAPWLTPEQQILLQCAQSGEPTSFVVCTGGRLAMREFVKCQGQRFGDSECFGPNNEIRKFIRNAGLGDIRDDTVVGQIGNAYLDYLKAQMSFNQYVLGEAQRTGAAIVTLVPALVDLGGQIGSGATRATGQFVQGLAGAGREIIERIFR